MPLSLSSPARNLFLLGSSGGDVVTNFFITIDQSSTTDLDFLPDEIKYNPNDQKYILAGTATDSLSKNFGWFEKRSVSGASDYNLRIESSSGNDTTLRAMELDINNNLTVVGKTGSVPWIAKYSNGGVIDWQSTTNSGDVEYTGITSDANGNYYACGSTPVAGQAQAFIEKFDSSGTPGWGKSAFMLGRDVVLNKVATNSRGEVVAVGYLEDDSKFKGYIVKIDTNTGEVLWDRTLETEKIQTIIRPCLCEDVYIDSNDQIYVVGRLFGISSTISFIIKYTAEGNMIWQRETPAGENFEYYQVKSDGETEQTIVLGRYFNVSQNKFTGVLVKYSKDGTVVWRRTILSSFGATRTPINLDADPSFYYLLYTDKITSDRYTFGKVSTSGNGLGDFEYTEGTGQTIDYIAINTPDVIGRLSDGSVRQDSSDLITYPFSANKLLFDDLATQVSNKKRQMDSADSFEYSGSPAIRPADFQELNLLGDVYSGSGDWLDQSGKGNNGIASLTEPFSGAGSVSFDGTGDYLTVGGPLQTTNAGLDLGTNDFCIEYWVYQEVSSYASECFLFDLRETSNNTSTTAFIVNGSFDSDWSNQLRWYWGNADRIAVDNFIEQNQWTHHAFVRNGDVFTVYKNGTSAGSATIVGQNLGTVPTPCVIGASRSGGSPVQAKYSNFRITIENPVYTGNFTPPTISLSPVAGTELLTCQGDTIADASANNFTITVNGNAAPTDDGPTWNASGWFDFDGVDDYIDVGDLGINMSQFTVEVWFKPNVVENYRNVIDCNYGAPDPADGIVKSGNIGPRLEMNSAGVLGWIWGASRSANDPFFAATVVSSGLAANTWHHTAIVVSGNQATNGSSYYNGSLASANGAQTSGGSTAWYGEFQNVNIGRGFVLSGRFFDGQIGEVRIYPRALTPAQVFQNYNATREKYTGVPASTDPGLTSTRTPA